MQIEVPSDALLDIVRTAIEQGFDNARLPEDRVAFTNELQALLPHSEDAHAIAPGERAQYFISRFVGAASVLDSARRIVVTDELTLQEANAALAQLPKAIEMASTILRIANGEINATPASYELSTKDRLRAQSRIQDDPRTLARLGYEGDIPEPPSELIERCARTGGTLVLMFKTTALAYQASYNGSLSSDEWHLRMYLNDELKSLAILDDEAKWVNVPNSVREDTLRLSKASALDRVSGGSTRDPMDTLLMLGYNNLLTGEQLPGFKDKWTFTNVKDVVVGSHGGGIRVDFNRHFDSEGDIGIGLAPDFEAE